MLKQRAKHQQEHHYLWQKVQRQIRKVMCNISYLKEIEIKKE